MSADTLNKHWKENKSASFGFKLMQKMGWDESKGLGKDENGRVDNIKVSKREVGLGLGSDAVVTLAEKGWSATSSSFESVLSLLNETYKKDKKSKKEKKEKKEKKAKKVTPIISVGMKYKKFSQAKDLSLKSSSELKAILGDAIGKKERSKSDNDDDDDDNNEKKKKKSKKSSKS